MQEGIEYDPALSLDPPVYRYGPVEIFPVGGFIYITDEVFDKEPQVALKIIELFFAKIEKLKQYKGMPSLGRQVETANLLWRLCVRPELMKYLFDYCEKYANRVDSGDAEMQRFVSPVVISFRESKLTGTTAVPASTLSSPRPSTSSKTTPPSPSAASPTNSLSCQSAA